MRILRKCVARVAKRVVLGMFTWQIRVRVSKKEVTESAISSHFQRPLLFVHGVGTRRCGSAASSVREVRGGPNRMRFGIRLVSLL